MGRLQTLFHPSSVAVIGASDKLNSVGLKVFKNLLSGKFEGAIYPVNPKHKSIQGHSCVASVLDIPNPIDLAVITTKASIVPSVLDECGHKKIPVAIVISAGFSEIGATGQSLEAAILAQAQRHHIRLMGPNCLGVMCPYAHLNATFDNNFALPGATALISQSGALSAGILDWAMEKRIGFSTIISLGNSADIDFDEILDELSQDTHTRSILLYIEGVHKPQRFLAALSKAASTKPVIVIKAGRNAQGSRAALSHTGALIGDDAVFDAALRRAGAVRVNTIEELFLAAEILSSNAYHVQGNRLLIMTNGGGAGVMAADRAHALGIPLPQLSNEALSKLNQILPSHWSHQNPVDIIGDASPARYHAALEICAHEKAYDGLLIILVPVAMAHPLKVAQQIIQDVKKIKKPVIVCWMGEKQVRTSWHLFEKHKIAVFDTPEKAIQAFAMLSDFHLNQQWLKQVPSKKELPLKTDSAKVRRIFDKALKENRSLLTTLESKKILRAFGIPVTQTLIASTLQEALAATKSLGFPVAMKIYSPEITHKQDVGGIALNLHNAKDVRDAFKRIIVNVKHLAPQAKIVGIMIEPMLINPNNRELMIGVIHDPVFGPCISFGMGGTYVEIFKDQAVSLPPLNSFLAHELIRRTQISHALGEFRHMKGVNLTLLIDALLAVSHLVREFPEIKEMDINPLIVNDKAICAVDARIIGAVYNSTMPAINH